MEEIIRVQDQYYILATSPRVDDRVRVLKHGDTFAVFDRNGDFLPIGPREEGLYHEGTRYLSRLELRLGARRPFLLSSAIKENVALLTAHLTNPDVYAEEELILQRNTLHVFRSLFVWEGTLYNRLRIRNFALHPVSVTLIFYVDADFADIFEVRGFKRARRGRALPPAVEGDGLVLAYEGLDGRLRRTRLRCSPAPTQASAGEIRFDRAVPPKGEHALTLAFTCESDGPSGPPPSFDQAVERWNAQSRELRGGEARLSSSNGHFEDWVARSLMDLQMMVTRTPHGLYPYAGIPWFSTIFGRDGLLTALQYLWLKPELARGVLSYLAATQAREVRADRDAEPGKILHEMRQGELAALGEIPFGRYYGSVDATPLFVLLAGAYFDRTADRAFIDGIWPNLEAALLWIERHGDLDGDGFVEYQRRSPRGLVNQGWKDSHDSVFHEDGALAEGPVALVEVQAYVYGAWLAAADLCEMRGEPHRANEIRWRARALQERFEEAFWAEDLGTYVLALDGKKRPCRIRTSNAGHALFSGIAWPERARRAAETLTAETSFSGWGIRTVASTEPRYNPMSYHNGSVWPHDNSIIALGFSRYPISKKAVARLFTGLYEASTFPDLQRLPELFCGFRRQPGEGPTHYPVACSPQAWSTGCPFMLLQASLGLSVDARRRQVRFTRPFLPEWLEDVAIRNLRVGEASLDLELHRHPRDVEVNVVNRHGDVEVVVVK